MMETNALTNHLLSEMNDIAHKQNELEKIKKHKAKDLFSYI